MYVMVCAGLCMCVYVFLCVCMCWRVCVCRCVCICASACACAVLNVYVCVRVVLKHMLDFMDCIQCTCYVHADVKYP